VKGVINLKFTPEARARVTAYIAGVDRPGATLCLMKSRLEPEKLEHWMYNAYDDENIPAVERMLSKHDRPLLYECDGLTVAIPQFHLIPELEGRTLALGERNRLVVLGGNHDG
jgi:hypothetical protein